MISNRTFRQLGAVDWDFPERFPGTSKNIHWYPGTFPAAIPATLIQAFSSPSDVVIDPYGGVGTTAAEAIRLGRVAVTVDNNPIALMAALTLNGLLVLKAADPALPEYVLDEVEAKGGLFSELQPSLLTPSDDCFPQQIDSILKSVLNVNPGQFVISLRKAGTPSWTDLQTWIEEGTLREIESAVRKFKITDRCSFSHVVGITMISACLKAASSQTQSWGHIADNVRPREFTPKAFDALCLTWIRKLRGTIRDISTLEKLDRREKKLYLVNHDWSQASLPKEIPRKKAKVLVTSPPYANAIDYTYAQRLSLHLLGYKEPDIDALSRLEIGARRKRFSSTSSTCWSNCLVEALQRQVKLLSDSAVICLILPHKEAGREVAAMEIEKYLIESGWIKVFSRDRSIRQSRTRQSWTSIKRETILVFQR